MPTTALIPWFVACIFLGQLTVLLDWGSRLFASSERTLSACSLRILFLLLCYAALTIPLRLLYFGIDTPLVRALVWGACVFSLVCFAHFLFPYRFGIRKVRTPQVRLRTLSKGIVLREMRLRIDYLPEALDGLSCLIISDLHCNSSSALSRLKSAIATLGKEGIDLLLILGDLSEKANMLPHVIETLSRIESRLGGFCVRGNHDFEEGRDALIESLLAQSPMRLLSNKSHTISDPSLTLLGVESPWNKGTIPKTDAGTFSIALMHTPDNLFRLERAGANLCLAGHTHGGGPGLPLIGHLLVPCRYGRFLHHGLFRLRNTFLLVTSGVGYPEECLWRRGEIVKLILERGASQKTNAPTQAA